ncbi:MAG: hypothetical protein ACI4FZ_10505 [Lachnospiraceae bacterium]
MGKSVVFWSPRKGRSGATSAMCAVAAALATGGKAERIAVTHTSFTKQETEERLDFRAEERKGELYERSGLSALMLNFKQKELTAETIRRCGILLPGSSMELFPGDPGSMSVLPEEEREDIMFVLMTKKLPMAYDMVLIDLESETKPLSMRMLHAADIAVVVLPQEIRTWKHFFHEEMKEFETENLFFLLGGAIEPYRYAEKEFRSAAESTAGKNRFGMILRNAEYLRAMEGGRVIEFFLKNERVRRKEENAAFLEQTREAAQRIREFANKAGGERKVLLPGNL